LYHSEHWHSAASYVALTRHRDKTQLFVARNTALDVKQLARQMARVDDRRAASNFYLATEREPVRPLTPYELAARLSDQAPRPQSDRSDAQSPQMQERSDKPQTPANDHGRLPADDREMKATTGRRFTPSEDRHPDDRYQVPKREPGGRGGRRRR
jgi:hypothetical protein